MGRRESFVPSATSLDRPTRAPQAPPGAAQWVLRLHLTCLRSNPSTKSGPVSARYVQTCGNPGTKSGPFSTRYVQTCGNPSTKAGPVGWCFCFPTAAASESVPPSRAHSQRGLSRKSSKCFPSLEPAARRQRGGERCGHLCASAPVGCSAALDCAVRRPALFWSQSFVMLLLSVRA